MEKIYDETYNSDNNFSRNIWYSDVEIHKMNTYGAVATLTKDLQQSIIDTINHDLKKSKNNFETNWYFYDSVTTKDANGDKVRNSLMIKLQNNKFQAHFNLSDHTFAINFQEIQKQLIELQDTLNN